MNLRKLLIFPGHRYLGPGNNVVSGTPVDSDDLIAQEHDLAYERAETKDDVFRADEKAILAFVLDWIKSNNWHSAIGALGLTLKNMTETIIGRVLYPKLDKQV